MTGKGWIVLAGIAEGRHGAVARYFGSPYTAAAFSRSTIRASV